MMMRDKRDWYNRTKKILTQSESAKTFSEKYLIRYVLNPNYLKYTPQEFYDYFSECPEELLELPIHAIKMVICLVEERIKNNSNLLDIAFYEKLIKLLWERPNYADYFIRLIAEVEAKIRAQKRKLEGLKTNKTLGTHATSIQ